jgi:hypothetical protein
LHKTKQYKYLRFHPEVHWWVRFITNMIHIKGFHPTASGEWHIHQNIHPTNWRVPSSGAVVQWWVGFTIQHSFKIQRFPSIGALMDVVSPRPENLGPNKKCPSWPHKWLRSTWKPLGLQKL